MATAGQPWPTSQGCSQPQNTSPAIGCEVQMSCAQLLTATLQQPLSLNSTKQFQDLLDPVNAHALADDDLHGMIFSMTSALERLSLEQQDATSLSLHVDLYARVLGAGTSRAQASMASCDEHAGWQGQALYQGMLGMVSKGIAAFSQVLALHGYMVPAVLPSLVSVSQAMLAIAQFTFFTPRLVAMLEEQQYIDASSCMRNGLKELTSISCSVITALLTSSDNAAASPEDQQVIQHCTQVAQAMAKVLLSIGQQVTGMVAQASSKVPKVLRSFAVVNIAWNSLSLLLTAIPQQWRPVLPDKALVAQVLQCALGWLQQELQQAAHVLHDANRLKVIRFWLQLVAKVSGAYPCAAAGAWQPLLEATQAVFTLMHSCTEEQMQLAHDLNTAVAPKLVAALVVTMTAEAEDVDNSTSLAAKVQQLTAGSAAGAGAGAADVTVLQAQVALVAAVLDRSAALQSGQLRLLVAEHLLPWLIKTTCVELYDQVLCQGMGDDSLWGITLQACLTLLICCHAAASGQADVTQKLCPRAWSSCQLQLYMLAAHRHPLVQHMACELLCTLLANGQPAFVEQQLRAVLQLLKVVAGVESLALGAHSVGGQLGQGLTYVLGRMLQVAPAPLRAQLQQELLSEEALQQAMASLPGTAAVVQLAGALYGACGSEVPGHKLEQSMVDLWTQAQQVYKQSREGPWAQSELQLLQSHLAWLLEGITVLSRHSRRRAAAAAGQPAAGIDSTSNAAATCALLAVDIISAAAQQQQAAPMAAGPHMAAALHVLAHTADLLNAETLASIVPALTQLQAQPACAAHAAAITAHMDTVLPPPAPLFHATLLQRHWALQLGAMESLVAYSRVAPANLKAVIPPQLLAEPHQLAFQTKLRSFMSQRLPQEEAVQQEQHALALLQQEGQQLRAGCAAGGQQALLAGVAAGVRALEKLVAEAAAAEPMQVDGVAGLAATHPVAVALADSRSQAAAVLQGICGLERSMRGVQAAALASLGPGDVHMLSSATSALLGDLASMSSKVRSLQDVIHGMRGQ